MKRNLSILLFISFSTYALAQNCEKLKYTYDATGNRILRQFTIEPCNQNQARMAGNEEQLPQIATTDYSQLQVYPNPASNMLYVQSIAEQSITELYLYDEQGKLVAAKKTNAQTDELPVQNLSKGIYYLHIHIETKPYIYRIIKH